MIAGLELFLNFLFSHCSILLLSRNICNMMEKLHQPEFDGSSCMEEIMHAISSTTSRIFSAQNIALYPPYEKSISYWIYWYCKSRYFVWKDRPRVNIDVNKNFAVFITTYLPWLLDDTSNWTFPIHTYKTVKMYFRVYMYWILQYIF